MQADHDQSVRDLQKGLTQEKNEAIEALRLQYEQRAAQQLEAERERLEAAHHRNIAELKEEIKAERRESYLAREAMQERMLKAEEEKRFVESLLDREQATTVKLQNEKAALVDSLKEQQQDGEALERRIVLLTQELEAEKKKKKKAPRA